jgi:hypothetical protein
MSQSLETERFENELAVLFDQPPRFDDNAAFAAAVAARLERPSRLRQLLTWSAAAVGAAFAVFGLSQSMDLDLSSVVTQAADSVGPTTLWLGVGIALAGWAALPWLTEAEA